MTKMVENIGASSPEWPTVVSLNSLGLDGRFCKNDRQCHASACRCKTATSLQELAKGSTWKASVAHALAESIQTGSAVTQFECEGGINHICHIWRPPAPAKSLLICHLSHRGHDNIDENAEYSPNIPHALMNPYGRIIWINKTCTHSLFLPKALTSGLVALTEHCPDDILGKANRISNRGKIHFNIKINPEQSTRVFARPLEHHLAGRMYALRFFPQTPDNSFLLKELASLRHVNKELQSNLRRLGHDLQTPMNAVVGFCQLIQRQTHEGIAIPENYFDALDAASLQITRLLQYAISVSQGATTDESAKLEPVNVEDCIRQAVQLVQTKRLPIIINLGDLPNRRAIGRHAWVLEVILNLISNAHKHGSSDLPININLTSTSSGTHLQTTIQNGATTFLDQKELGNVLAGLKHKSKDSTGHGLGIANSSHLARLMGGELSFEYSQENILTAKFTLPAL